MMFQIVSGMPLRLQFMNICTRSPITKRFGNAISDNQVDSTQKSNIVIDVCSQLKNQPNKFSLKVLFLKVKSIIRSEIEFHCNP